jgi:hypothetical protein
LRVALESRRLALSVILLAPLAGGCAAKNSTEASRAGAFSIIERDGLWWLEAPGRRPFFSLGVCCVDQGISREAYDPAKPGYAAWRHHVNPEEWAEATIARLKRWGFTTVGGWSDDETLRRSPAMDLQFTRVLHVGSTAGAPWFDQWDPAVIARMDAVAKSKIVPVRGDPRLIGYYTDNELGWWNATLVKMGFEQPGSSGQRKRLVEVLRASYGGDWSRLRADFDPDGAASFEELDRKGVIFLRPGGGGVSVLRRMLTGIAERYYALVRELVRSHDARALILGDRYQSFYYPEVARAAGPHVDAVSTNLNATWNDGTFPRFYLDTLHALSGRPILIGELYAAATENRSGNPNSHGGFLVARNQAERARAFRTTLEALLRLPFVVGADWFQWYDEPTHGRPDGEDYNMGLLDIHDAPYEEMTAVVRSIDVAKARRAPRTARADAFSQGVPRAPAEPLGEFLPQLAMKRWDRERGFVPAASGAPTADLYVAWDDGALYVGLIAMDFAEDALYRDGKIAEEDRMLWTISIDGAVVLSARIGAGRAPEVTEGRASVVSTPDGGHGVYTLAASALPSAVLGKPHLAAGDALELRSTLISWGRAHRVDWSAKLAVAR